MKFAKAVVRLHVPIIVLTLLLMIPSVLGYIGTRVNYDMLDYLPEDMDTVKGQALLMEDFGKGAFSLIVAEDMPADDVSALKKKIEAVDHVETVLWYDSFADISIPMELLPDRLYDAFNTENATMMAVFFDSATSEDVTMDAIREIRQIVGKQCFVSGMSALVTDLKDLCEKEEPIYVGIAVALALLAMLVFLDNWLVPFIFLLSIGMMILLNLGTNFFLGEISYITKALSAVLQLAVTMDYSIFLWNSYNEELASDHDRNASMARAISRTLTSVIGSSITTVAGFIALCFMSFTLGRDLGIVMAKGVVFGVLTCITTLPAMILLFDKAIAKTAHKPLTIRGEKLSGFIVRHNKVFLVLMLLLWIPAIYGYQHVNVYYDLDVSLPDYLPSVQSKQELKEHFDMSTVHLILADEKLPSSDAKQMLNEMKQVDGVQFALATDSLIGSRIPKAWLPETLTGKLTSGGRQLILIGTKYAVASDEMNEQIGTLEKIMKKYDPSAMLIGEGPGTRDLIRITDTDFKMVSAVSIGAIFLIILVVLHSPVLPVLLVLVIELAIYINMGVCGFTGEKLPFVASIVIGTIQLGATVDYAILMTDRYVQERLQGKDKKAAATTSLAASMPSIFTSALGFFAATIGVGIYSDVDMIGSLCRLMARGALISMAMVLLLLPAFYLLFDPLIMKTRWKSPAERMLASKRALRPALHHGN